MVTKPDVGGSEDTWGTVLNTALDELEDLAQERVQAALWSGRGDLVTADTAGVPMRLPVGTNGQALIADSAATGGIRWALAPGTCVLHLRQTVAQNVADGAADALIFDTADVNTVGGWSAGAPTRFQPTVPGRYLLSGGASFAASATGYRSVRWYRLGSMLAAGAVYVPPIATPSTVIPARTVPALFNGSTDYVELFVQHTAGATLATSNSTQSQPYITAVYAGPA